MVYLVENINKSRRISESKRSTFSSRMTSNLSGNFISKQIIFMRLKLKFIVELTSLSKSEVEAFSKSRDSFFFALTSFSPAPPCSSLFVPMLGFSVIAPDFDGLDNRGILLSKPPCFNFDWSFVSSCPGNPFPSTDFGILLPSCKCDGDEISSFDFDFVFPLGSPSNLGIFESDLLGDFSTLR